MRRKLSPLTKLDVEDKDAKAKVSLVLQVLSGEKTITEACKETGIKPISYYKLEERMVRAMVAAAQMPSVKGRRRKDPLAEATSLAQETEQLRQEHRRLASLMRISGKLFRVKRRRKNGPGRPKGSTLLQTEGALPVRKPGRPPLTPATT